MEHDLFDSLEVFEGYIQGGKNFKHNVAMKTTLELISSHMYVAEQNVRD